jgi:hypothetical protein
MSELTEYMPLPINPDWVEIDYNGNKRWVLSCTVSGKDYDVCIASENKVDRLGEMALSQIIQIPLSFQYEKTDTSFDFMIDTYSLDIITDSSNVGFSNVNASDSEGKMRDLPCDYYVSAYVNEDNAVAKTAEVIIVGVMDKGQIKKLPRTKHESALLYQLKYDDSNLDPEKIRSMVALINKKNK